MKCDWCGKEFPDDARACVEAGIGIDNEPEPGEEWKATPVIPQISPEQREQLKKEMELDDAQFDELLANGKIEGLGAIVCLECQDGAEEHYE